MKLLLRVPGALLLAAGVGFAAWGGMSDQAHFRAPFGWTQWIATPGEAVGYGVSAIVLGALMLLAARTAKPPR